MTVLDRKEKLKLEYDYHIQHNKNLIAYAFAMLLAQYAYLAFIIKDIFFNPLIFNSLDKIIKSDDILLKLFTKYSWYLGSFSILATFCIIFLMIQSQHIDEKIKNIENEFEIEVYSSKNTKDFIGIFLVVFSILANMIWSSPSFMTWFDLDFLRL